jgi:hypothetical protein
MTIEPTINGVCKTLSSEAPYFFCTYNSDNEIEIYQDNEVSGDTSTISNIFGADTIEAMDSEIITRNLTEV